MIDRVTREIAEAKRRHVIDGYIEKPASLSAILEEMRRNLMNCKAFLNKN